MERRGLYPDLFGEIGRGVPNVQAKKKINYRNNNTEVTGNLFDLNIKNMFEQKNIVTLQSVARNAL